MFYLKDKNLYIILDFDSTFVTVETLDLLAEICLKRSKNEKKLVAEIAKITNAGMAGSLPFSKSLEKRLDLFQPTVRDLKEVIKKLQTKVSKSIERNKDFFLANSNRIYIISGGFEEFIYPVVKNYGIRKTNIIANKFLHKNGEIAGYDKTKQTAKDNGKANAACSLNLSGKIFVIGDGMTDFEIVNSNQAEFIAFTENVTRENVIALAKIVAKDFEEVIKYLEK